MESRNAFFSPAFRRVVSAIAPAALRGPAFVGAATGILLLAACGGSDVAGPPPILPAPKWVVTPSAVSIPLGTSVTINAQLTEQSGVPRATAGLMVVWSATRPGSFSSSTSVTNAAGLATVTFTPVPNQTPLGGFIRVTAAANGTLSGNVDIFTVAGPPASYRISVQPFEIPAGTVARLTAQLVDAYGNYVTGGGRSVTWSTTVSGTAFSSPTSLTQSNGAATIDFATSGVNGTLHTVVAKDGDGTSGTLVIGTTFPFAQLLAVSAGVGNTCALAVNGGSFCWGAYSSPTPVGVPGAVAFASLVSGGSHDCGLTAAGVAYCWGGNAGSQLGDGTSGFREFPILVSGNVTFTALSAGADHTCGIAAGGALYCWGDNSKGQIGDGSLVLRATPTRVGSGLTFSSVSAGKGHTCGVTVDGSAYCWGFNYYSQLGDSTNITRTTPAKIAGNIAFASVVAADTHTCGLSTTGAGYCWGDNTKGQLGTGAAVNTVVPTPVAGGKTFSSITVAATHSCGITTAGAAFCWGWNAFGQLGNDSDVSSSVPVPVAGGLAFASISAAGGEYEDSYYGSRFIAEHTCGVTTGRVAYCWGSNDFGQLGTALSIWASRVPVKVARQ